MYTLSMAPFGLRLSPPTPTPTAPQDSVPPFSHYCLLQAWSWQNTASSLPWHVSLPHASGPLQMLLFLFS
jgi:hypothetical protein